MKNILVIKKLNDILDNVRGDNIKEEICSKKDEIYKNNFINRFIKIVNNKRELKSNNKFLLKQILLIFY